MEAMVFKPLGVDLRIRSSPQKNKGGKEMKWKNEGMEKLRQYDAMCHALRNIPEEISCLKMDASALRDQALYRFTPALYGFPES